MRYEIYIDVLFFTNFMMDSLVLLSVRKVLKYQVPTWRVFLGSAVGAGITCLVIVLPIPVFVKAGPVFLGISLVMIKIGLSVNTWKEFGKAVGVLYLSAFLMGGILQALYPYMRTGKLFFATAVGSYVILTGGWKFLLRIKSMQKKVCEVLLVTGQKKCEIQALVDTGNRLTDPISREPVHVIDRETARQIGVGSVTEAGKETEECELSTLRFIPYRTVSGTGVMPIFRIEKMCIRTEQECWVTKPILGICGEILSDNGEYQMILNADIL